MGKAQRCGSQVYTHTSICPSNLEQGMDAWQDVMLDAVMAGADAHAVEAVHRCPYHMSEVHS